MTDTPLPPILGFTGTAGSGKTAAARALLRAHGTANQMSFAGPLKSMARELIRAVLPRAWDHDASGYIDDPTLKETPLPFLLNITPRRLMQTLGTEWGRNVLHPDFWVIVAAAKVERQLGSTFKKSDRVPLKMVFDDVRFANEAEMIRAYGGKIIRIVRPDRENTAEVASHASEAMDFEADLTVINDGTKEELEAKMLAMFPVPPKEPRAPRKRV